MAFRDCRLACKPADVSFITSLGTGAGSLVDGEEAGSQNEKGGQRVGRGRL